MQKFSIYSALLLAASVFAPMAQAQLTITGPNTLPVAVVFDAYAPVTFTASGGAAGGPPYQFAIVDGGIPNGMTVSSAGVLSGTPTQSGDFNFTLRVQTGPNTVGFRNYVLTSTFFDCPTPSTIVGDTYSSQAFLFPFVPISFAITGGSIPQNFSFNSTNGTLSGVPTAESTYNYTITATDSGQRTASHPCALNIQSQLQLMSPRTTGRVGVPYSSKISVLGGTGPYSYALIAGTLPQGLSLLSNGRVTGTPTLASSTGYQVRVQDTLGNVTQRNFTLTVLDRIVAPTLRCPLPAAVGGQAYSSAFSINATGNLSYSVQGALPGGLTLNSSTGELSGTLSGLGTFTFNATATGSSTGPVTTSCTIQVTQFAPPFLRLGCPDQEDLVAGEFYNSPVIATGGLAPFTYSLYQTSLPSGLTLDANSGLVSGTPAVPGTYTYYVQVLDSQGFSSAAAGTSSGGNQASALSQACTAVVANPPPLTLITTSLPNGLAGSSYSVPVVATGGVKPYSFTVSNGSLPQGLSINSSTGLITGSPAQAQSSSFRITVMDYLETSVFRDYTINIFPPDPLRFTSSTVDLSTVGVVFSQNLGASGGAPPYVFTVKSGSPAPGVTLASNGQLRGTPTTAGTFRFTVELSDSASSRVEGVFDMSVFQGAFRIGCPNATAELGVPYSSAANVLGGTPAFTFSIADGSLPPGLTLAASTGLISGRPTQTGSSIFSFAVSDAGQIRTQSRCSISVAQGALRILTESPITGRAGELNRGKFDAGGGTSPYTFAVSAAPAELGLTVNADGNFSWNAQTKGTYVAVVRVVDGAGTSVAKSFTFNATAGAISISCPVPATFTLGSQVNAFFQITGGILPYTLDITTGALPGGLTLGRPDSSGRAALTGKPIVTGDFSPTLRATDANATTVTTQCNLKITGDPLTITTDALSNGTVAIAYSGGLAASGPGTMLRWGLIAGSLPDGLALSPDSGAIAGTPLKAGTFSFTASVSDEFNRNAAKALSITVAHGDLQLTITTPSPLSDAVIGKTYSAAFNADGGKAPYELTISGGLPAGIAGQGSAISGTPSSAGENTFTVSVKDAAGRTAAKQFALTVKAADGLIISTDTLPDGTIGQTYTPGVNAQGGTPAFGWTILSGSIPPGVTFNPATATFSGTPMQSGQFTVSIQVTDASGTAARKTFSFEVRPDGIAPLQVTTSTLPNGSAGVAYNLALGATGGQPPYTWAINGDLPSGITANSAGVLSGIPQTIGAANFLATVTDTLGLRATRGLSLRIGNDTAPGVSIEGPPDSLNVNQSVPITLRIASPFGLPVTGRLTLAFVPDTIHNTDDPQVRFGNGTRTLDFTIPAGSTQITITGSGATVQAGTLAGTIRITSVLNFAGTSAAGPTTTTLIRRAVPVITNLRLTRASGSIEVRVEGYSNTRQLSEARITFTTASGVDVSGSTQVTVNVQSAIQAWFASAASLPFGGQFALTLPFTVTGDPANFTGVSVVITNGEGPSAPSSAN